MKKLITFLFTLWVLATFPAQAQEPIYFPVIGRDGMIKAPIALTFPRAAYNYVKNPSGETTGNFSAVSGATVNRVTTYQKYGLYSYEVTATASGRGLQLDLETLAASTHYFTARIRASGQEFRFRLGSTTKTPILLEKIDDYWNLWGIPFTASEASAATSVQITRFGTGGGSVFYVDGVQVEPATLGGYTTYIDGTQEGCKWLGSPHASRSFRSGESKAGGVVQDFYQEYGFFVEKIVGGGSATQENLIDSYAQLPGGELNDIKTNFREFSVIGWFLADTEEQLHDNQQRLELALDSKAYAQEQPTRLRFYGSKVQKEISAYYKTGLEGDLSAFYDRFSVEDDEWKFNEKFRERAAIQFDAPDPFWYEVGESAKQLDTNDNATLRYLAGRLSDTGQWSNLGLSANPTTGGTILAIAISPFDGKIYFGGDFTGLGGVAGRSYIAAYNPTAGTWETVGSASDFNGTIRALAFGPDGTLYAGGFFTNVAGNANADYFAQKPPGGSWTNLGSGGTLGVTNITVAPNGDIYIGGTFDNWAGIASADKIAYYDISAGAWAAVVAGANEEVRSIIWLPDMSRAYFGGEFTNWGDANGDYIVSWNGSALSSLSTGADNQVYTLALSKDGILYIGGAFENIGGIAASGVASYNGQSFQPLGSGIPSPDVEKLAIGPDGMIYAVGFFSEAGGIDLTQSAARFNGYAWGHLDIKLPSSFIVSAVAVGEPDPVIPQNYDLFIGFDTSGTGTYAGTSSIENDGSAPAFPKIIINRDGGNEAILESIRNERTGLTLLCDYDLLDGETVTIDLYPKDREESSSFFGDVAIVLPNSNLSQWSLLPGENTISAFVSESGSPTVLGYLLWRDSYRSYN